MRLEDLVRIGMGIARIYEARSMVDPGRAAVSSIKSSIDSAADESTESYDCVSDGSTTSLATASKVPAGRLARAAGYAGLATSMLGGAVGAYARGSESVWLSESNSERLVSTLSRMRGAALKLGQLLSMQGEELIPPSLERIFERVRNSASPMPWSQAEVSKFTFLVL